MFVVWTCNPKSPSMNTVRDENTVHELHSHTYLKQIAARVDFGGILAVMNR